MRLSNKLTSPGFSAGQTKIRNQIRICPIKNTAGLLFSVLFLLASSSCSVPKELRTQNRAEQNTDVNRLSVRNDSLGEPTSIAQQSDINEKTSPAIASNDVRAGRKLPALHALEASVVHSSDILGLFVPPAESSRAITVGKDGLAYLWNVAESRSYKLFQIPVVPIEVVAFDASALLLAAAQEKEVRIYSILDGGEVAVLKKLKTRVASLFFQPGGQSLVLGGADGEVYRWRFVEERKASSLKEAEKYFERYFGHANVVSAVAYHPIGRIFFSADWSGALNAWLPYDTDPFGGKYDENVFGAKIFSDRSTRSKAGRASTVSIEHLRVSNDGEVLVAGGQDGMLEWWLVRGFTLAATVSAHKGLLYDIALAPSGKTVATLGRDGKLRTWKLTQTLTPDTGKVAYSIEKAQEVEAPGNRKVDFADEGTVVLGDSTGRISTLKL